MTRSNFSPIIFNAFAISETSSFPDDVSGRFLSPAKEEELSAASPCRKMNKSIAFYDYAYK
jgi:hypothetical protein